MNGQRTRQAPATTKGTVCAISPQMKCTSRLSRSSFATPIEHLLTARFCQRSGKLWAALKSVTAFTGFDFNERAD